MIGSARCLAGMTATACVLGAIGATTISGTALAATSSGCDQPRLTQPFTRWADRHLYERVSGGSFERGLSGWSLQGGARQVLGGEPFGGGTASGSHSLLLPRGASASSPRTCVNATYRTFRLFARAVTPGARLAASIAYPTEFGTAAFLVGVIAPGSRWQPTPPMSTGAAVSRLWAGTAGSMTLRFSASGGTVQIDDVYLDPHGRCC